MFSKGEDLNIYRFLGRLLGKAIYEGITVEPRFADFFLRKLIHKPSSLQDLKSLDYELFKQLNFIRSYEGGSLQDMGLYFTTVDECPLTGQSKDIDLIYNGSETAVTDENKFRFIYMVADYRLNKRIKKQCDAFVDGFHECMPLQWLGIFEEREVQMLISGLSK